MKHTQPLASPPTDAMLPATTDQLLEQLDWARSLARRLVADPNAAEDLVQETYVRALQNPPDHRPGEERRLRAWFGRVLTNVARQRGRSEGRRSRREEERATPEALPSASELTEAAEGQRLLIEALLELDEDLRHIVLLRHYQGLNSTEIARRLGEPAGTIRWRLSAALDDLRGKLDRRTGGDRSIWQSALLPLTQLPARPLVPAAAAPAALTSGLSFGGLALASVAILLVGLGLAVSFGLVRTTPPSIEPGPSQAAGLARGEPSGRVASTPARPELGATREEPAETGPGRAAEAAPALATGPQVPAAARVEIRARFVDSNGRGVAGVQLARHGAKTGASEADGSLSAQFDHHGFSSTDLIWTHPEYVTDGLTLHAELDPINDLGVIALEPGGSLIGRLLNERGGPLAGYAVEVRGAEVRSDAVGGLTSSTATSRGAAADTTDEDGRFQLSGLLPGRVDLLVDDDAEIYSTERKGIAIAAAAPPTEVELRIEPVALARRFAGRVVAPDGEPARAQLHFRYSRWFSNSSRSFTTNMDGSFAFSVPAGVSKIDLDVQPTDAALITKRFPDLRSGQTDLVLQLDAPRSFRVAPRLAGGGAPPGDLALTATSIDGEREFDSNRRREPDPLGIELQLPAEPFTLSARARGYFTAERTPLRPDQVADTTLEIELTPRPAVTGTVANGEFGETEVSLYRSPRGRARVAGQPSFVDQHPADQAAPNALGAYRLFVVEPGRYYLRATAPGRAASFTGPFELDPRRPFELPPIQLTPGGTVEGTVASAAQVGRSTRVMATSGDGVPVVELTDAAGRFRFEHLRPGAWSVQVLGDHDTISNSSVDGLAARFEQIPGNVEVAEGRVTRFDVGLLPERIGGALLLSIDLDPAFGEGWEASLVDADNAETVEPLGADGEARLAFAAPGALRLVLRQDDDLFSLAILRDLDLNPGEHRLHLEIRAGTVRFAEPAEVGEGATPGVLQGEDLAQELFFMRILEPGQASALFPAGSVSTADVRSGILSSDPRAGERIDRGELSAGGTVELELY